MPKYYLPKTAFGKGGFGWGICGDNLAYRLKNKYGFSELEQGIGYVNDTVVSAIAGPHFSSISTTLSTTNNVGIGFIEDNITAERYFKNIYPKALYDHIVCGSISMMQELIEMGCPKERLIVIHQGVNHYSYDQSIGDLFDPYNRKSCNDVVAGKFMVGSFGKLEYRKGQDIVVEAVRIAQDLRPRANIVLAHNWINHWPATIDTFSTMSRKRGSRLFRDALTLLSPSFKSSTVYEQSILVSMALTHSDVENEPIGGLYTEFDKNYAFLNYNSCDICVFPNRKEAGTNLPLMEAIMCGVPCIYTNEHGHKDIPYIKGNTLLEGDPFTAKNEHSEVGTYYDTDPYVLAEAIVSYVDDKNGVLALDPDEVVNKMMKFTWQNMAKAVNSLC